ncbi:cytochrome P450 [Colletotrichum zoysiae]|uniref:Cytochrome P450 n=1 Tax=Colletotrichum zoysiae TaxID=1216348 RepID=A0AAD9HH34_9PEZI|nr:cytochrome P450 [Colletotrichum zoysiae]
MGYVYTALILLPCLFVASHLWTLQKNYRAALLTGLPIIVIPYNPDSAIHAIFSVPLRPVLRRLLPTRIYDTISIVIFGWEFLDESAVHDRIGPAFIVVTTSQNQLICADPAMAQVILAKRNDFVQGDVLKRIMGFAGDNVQTSNGDSWSRQRRIVATALNERISPGVWKETAAQAASLTDFLLSPASPSGETADTIPGLRAVAINVLNHIAYGVRKPFALISLPRDPKADMTYVDGISLCASLLVVAALAPHWLLCLPVMPKLLQTLAVARARLPDLARGMLDQERRRAADETADGADGQAGPRTIMSLLVGLSDQEKKQQAASDAAASSEKKAGAGGSAMINKTYLTEDEIGGNLFIFTIAGFDTTANTLAYAVTLLAAYPEWQAWIQAEIDAVLGPAPLGAESDDELPDYAAAYPKLVRCLAVMYEVLRLYPPLTHLMRSTETAQTMSYPSSHPPASASSSSPSTFTLGAAPSLVYINTVALHTSPSTWGPDALAFKPSRWLQPANAAVPGDEKEEEAEVKKKGDQSPPSQQFFTPPRGTYVPWSGGPRACPGQKMSQVEFVTVVATLFRRCTVEPARRAGESAEGARRRLLDLTRDSQPIVTLQMKRPDEVRLRWTRR